MRFNGSLLTVFLFSQMLVALLASTSQAQIEESTLETLRPADAPFRMTDAGLSRHLDLDFYLKLRTMAVGSTSSKILAVYQQTFAVLNGANTRYEYIGTNHASFCVNVALLDVDHKIASLGHFDIGTDIDEAIVSMTRLPDGTRFQPTRVVLASSYALPFRLQQIIEALQKEGLESIAYVKSSSLIVNREGDVFAYSFVVPQKITAELIQKSGLAALPGSSPEFLSKRVDSPKTLRMLDHSSRVGDHCGQRLDDAP